MIAAEDNGDGINGYWAMSRDDIRIYYVERDKVPAEKVTEYIFDDADAKRCAEFFNLPHLIKLPVDDSLTKARRAVQALDREFSRWTIFGQSQTIYSRPQMWNFAFHDENDAIFVMLALGDIAGQS